VARGRDGWWVLLLEVCGPCRALFVACLLMCVGSVCMLGCSFGLGWGGLRAEGVDVVARGGWGVRLVPAAASSSCVLAWAR